MMTVRRRGFTLIELLVVIAIIGILAAMLFPVFARARESARKIQCLSNVKNIAMAINMYISDWDKFLPIGYENDKVADKFFASRVFRSGSPCPPYASGCGHCNHIRDANPYSKEPVILDEYIKNRDVWRCPSAKVSEGAGYVVPAGRGGYWVNNYIDHVDTFYKSWLAPPCQSGWPTGWGGAITDSFVQGLCQHDGKADEGAFVSSIGINDNLHWETPQSISDAARYVAVGEEGLWHPWNVKCFGWPDINLCGMGYNPGDSVCGDAGCCGTNDPGCPWSLACGLSHDEKVRWWTDPTLRNSRTRHMGGVNLGFVDGHAKWCTSESILAAWRSPEKAGSFIDNSF